jgi:hypothetical protein
MQNNVAKYFPLLKYSSGIVFHVGAHKFEELDAYVQLEMPRVLWFDPIPNYVPPILPQGHTFYAELIMNTESEYSFNFYEAASGFSSIYTPKNNKLLHSKIEKSFEKKLKARKLSDWQTKINNDPQLADKTVTLTISSQGTEFDVLQSADLSKISQIMVLTSKSPIYEGASESRNRIQQLLKENGFNLNLDLADLIFGHGFQYWSKENKNFYFYLSMKYKMRTLLHFSVSVIRRALIAISIRFKFV